MEKTDRRRFIKKTGIASIAGMLVPDMLLAEKNKALKSGGNAGRFTILFQGDSITDGNRARNTDWNHVMGHGFAYLIACRLWFDNIGKNLMFYNRGISGNKVKDLDARWQTDTIDLQPNVISILVGVNDVLAIVNDTSPDTIGQFEEKYTSIILKTKTALPNARLVLCEPFILKLGHVDTNTETWQKEIKLRQGSVRKLAKLHNAIFVGFQDLFDEACKKAPSDYWIWDGIHPMPAGHELMARHWIKEVCHKIF